MNGLTVKEAIARAAALCSKKEYCRSEIRAKLGKWEVDDPEQVIHYLEKEKYLDEQRYAIAFVRDKFRFNKWGRVKIRHHLKHKQVPDAIISTVLEDEIDQQAYLGLLKELLHAQRKKVKAKNDYDLKAKLYRFAYARGFEGELVNQFIDES